MSVDEVAFGLALQSMTPFRFSCNRLLMRRLPELQLPVYNLIRLLDPLVRILISRYKKLLLHCTIFHVIFKFIGIRFACLYNKMASAICVFTKNDIYLHRYEDDTIKILQKY